MNDPIETDRRRAVIAGVASLATVATPAAAQTARPRAPAVRSDGLGTGPAGGVQDAIVQSQTFDHVCLCARDLERVTGWYKRVFGFQETHRFELPGYVGVPAELMYLRLGNMQLEVFGNPEAAIARPEPMSFPETIGYTGFQHFCVRVDDMDATIAALEAAAIPIFLGPNTNDVLGRTFIHIKDPEGNDCEIVEWETDR